MKNTFYSIFILLGIFICFSCGKSNIDEMIPEEEEEIEVETVVCDLVLEVVGEDGLLTANPENGTEPYTFEWSTAETTQSIRVDEDGTYSVEVVDAEGCIAAGVVEVILSTPCEDFDFDLIYDSENSSLSASVIGGTAPYAFIWSNGETTDRILVNSFGTYEVTVTDSEGCELSKSIEVDSDADPCSDLMGQIIYDPSVATLVVAVFGGSPPYNYRWSTGAMADRIDIQVDGMYEVTITDSNGCTIIESITIDTGQEPCNDLIANFEYDADAGTLGVSASGGLAPYRYLWSTGETTGSINVVSGMSYTLTLTDANGCMEVIAIDIP